MTSTPKEWRRLQFQSRLHSKGGRSLGFDAGPLQPADHGHQRAHPETDPAAEVHCGPSRAMPHRRATQVEELFIIERGTPRDR